MLQNPKQVKKTSHINFDEHLKTFRLYAKDSLYAFCLSPELTLEHLYWGKKLQEGYDLRYLSQGCRVAAFNTVEAAPHSFDGKIRVEAETLEEVQKTWKENRVWSSNSNEEENYAQKKRLENYSWRIMSKWTFQPDDLGSSLPSPALANTPGGRRKSLSVSFDEDDIASKISEVAPVRRRSISNLQGYKIDPSINLKDLQALTRLATEDKETTNMKSPSRFLDSITAMSSPGPHYKSIQTFERQLGKLGKGALCVEYNDHGTGDFRSPSFVVVDHFNGSAISPLRYRSHKIYKGKIPIEGMPSIRCLDENEASTLVVTLVDAVSGLEVDLIYTAMHNYDCITRRAIFRNKDQRPHSSEIGTPSLGSSKVIQKASSMTIDFECAIHPFHVVQLSGSWARERYVVETKLNHGMHSFGSMSGLSGHQHNPFAAVCFGPSSETNGEVKGFSLVYSGNYLLETEINEMGRLRVNLGIHPMGLQWHLRPGSDFNTPEAVLVRSGEGLGGMSRAFHRLFLDRLLPRHWSDESPPILLNSWEAKYFHVNHNNMVEMTKQASKVGINLIVLDDGWFGKRNDDRTSLGDWIADIEKFPYGLKGLAEEINALGCKFGLWFEPEMVSEESMLFTSHPDWYLHVPGRPRQIGRNQLVLDLSRQDVRDHIFSALSAVLSSANIEYVKWDMNRPLTEVYSIAAGSGEVWQAEISHRYVLGVYELQDRLVKFFPHVLLENCASGGGRFDPGMLYYSPQIWCSDNTDALVRMKIQYGTSYVYPARCIGAHVSTVPNHITGNTTRLRTRAFVAMSGSFGYELDISSCSANDLLKFQKQIDFFKQIAPIVRWGDLYRLWDPFKASLAAWMYVSRDKSEAIAFAYSTNADHWNNIVPRLPLMGLIAEAEYEVVEPAPNDIMQVAGTYMMIETEVPVYQLGVSSVVLTGEILMSAGLPVRFYTLDDAAVFLLKRVN
eukprot:gene13876-15312_t